MPAEVSANHAFARIARGWVFLDGADAYFACGDIVMTQTMLFVSGHLGQDDDHGVIVSLGIPMRRVSLIEDRSVEACETHDVMDAEAKALMELIENGKENQAN